ncbi:MAG: hypothetical protein ABSF91_09820 [Bacteroidota bacterium]|jgi:hypothetical protein
MKKKLLDIDLRKLKAHRNKILRQERTIPRRFNPFEWGQNMTQTGAEAEL